MDIIQTLSSVMRKWRLIVLLVVIGGGLGLLMVYFAKPMYQADTTLYIMNRDKMSLKDQSLSSQDLEATQQLVRQSTEIITSRLVTAAVLRDVKQYNLTEKELLLMVNINSNLNSNLIKISARGSDPTVVAAVANATGSEFMIQIRQLTNSNILNVLDEAIVPNFPVPNNGPQKVFLGMLAGLFVALGIIYILEYFDTTVRSAEDIENGLNVRVIGIIPEHDIR
ncbi:MAG: Wzz/FepE/Etk N-terminal domain-containing protein [Desulfosporosinus sp.]|nr:Wzz/FepE/Etk N-terminal domain-containing protein [Desulfosporosinus sp.]